VDTEALPYDDDSYDVVISGMVLELSPEPQKMINEMVRVVRPGGIVALSTHGTNHYTEALDACFRAATKRYVLGYRIEYWPMEETKLKQLFSRAKLVDVATRRITWQDDFGTGDNAYGFTVSTSSRGELSIYFYPGVVPFWNAEGGPQFTCRKQAYPRRSAVCSFSFRRESANSGFIRAF
jgi:SAM-dependent methyltransferase